MMNKYRCAMALLLMVVATVAFAGGATEGAPELTVISHRVHQDVATGGQDMGANLVERFEARYNAKVEHQTLPVSEIHDKLLRLGPLQSTREDVIYVDYNWADPRTERFLVPLNDYLDASPIPDFPGDWPSAMVSQWTFEDKIYAIPVRAGTSILWYNKEIFAERGINGPPTNVAELLEIARQTTFTRESGEQVYGFVCKGSQYEVGNSVIQVLSQMYGGFPWSPSWEVQLNSGPVAKGVELLRTLYSEELMPANWATMDFAEVVKMFQEGRVAMGIYPHNYSTILNNPEQAVSPGSAVPAYLPLATEAQTADRTFAGSFLWFWSMGILSGSDNKDLAWQFIYDLSLRDARLEMARSGNATARISVTAEQESPGVKIAAETSRYSFPANPPSPKSNEIIDTIGDAVHQIVLSDAPLQQTLDRAADRLRELIED